MKRPPGPAAIVFWLASFTVAPVLGQTPAEFELQRRQLVDQLLAHSGITDRRVLQALRSTARHEFVPADLRSKAYLDMGLPIGDQQTISSPLVVAQMTQALKLRPTDKVLEIGTGSGYQAAVLSPLVKDVYSIEIVESLARKAKSTLDRLGYKNIHAKVGDGFRGWPEYAPFDKIIVTCSPEKVPQPLIDQLSDGGLLVVPVGDRYAQTLCLFIKRGDNLEKHDLLPTLFVPMTGQAEQGRAHQPDPLHPSLYNGSFEENPHYESSAGQPGWFYERLATRHADAGAPHGRRHIEFKNSEPNLDGHLMQGFAIDGRQVTQLEVSGWVKTENVVEGKLADQVPYIVVTLYDDQRQQIEHLLLGPFRGTRDWHHERKTFQIPHQTREALCRIGLFGATGMAAFDNLEVKRVQVP